MTRILVLVAALIVFGLLFALLEWFWPSIRGQRRWRRGVKTDIAYFFWGPS